MGVVRRRALVFMVRLIVMTHGRERARYREAEREIEKRERG